MVEDEVNGYYRGPEMTYSHQSLVHDIYPALLGKDLEHGHECLQGGKHRMREGERGKRLERATEYTRGSSGKRERKTETGRKLHSRETDRSDI